MRDAGHGSMHEPFTLVMSLPVEPPNYAVTTQRVRKTIYTTTGTNVL